MNYLWLVNVLCCNTSAFSCIFDRTEEDEDKEEDKDKEEEDKEARSLSLQQELFFPSSKKKNKTLCLGFCIEFINPKQKNLKRWSLFTPITLYIYKRINHRALRILSTPLRESKTRSAREKKKKKKKKTTTVCRVDAPKHLIKLFFLKLYIYKIEIGGFDLCIQKRCDKHISLSLFCWSWSSLRERERERERDVATQGEEATSTPPPIVCTPTPPETRNQHQFETNLLKELFLV